MGKFEPCGVDGVTCRGGVQESLSCSSVSESDVYFVVSYFDWRRRLEQVLTRKPWRKRLPQDFIGALFSGDALFDLDRGSPAMFFRLVLFPNWPKNFLTGDLDLF